MPELASGVIPFTGTVSWQLFRRVQWKHLGAKWLLLFLFPVATTAYMSFVRDVPSRPSWVWTFILSSMFVPMMLAMNVVGRRRMYTKSPYLRDFLVGSLSSETYIVEGDTGRTEMTWDRFVRVREGKDLVLLYLDPSQFQVLAREFFESDDAWETARRFARRISPG